MATTLPVPVVFDLPDRWVPADPDAAGAPGAAFVARLPGHGRFRPTITIDGHPIAPGQGLSDLAAGSVDTLSRDAEAVEVLDRRDLDQVGDAPGLVQALGITVLIDDSPHDLAQDQVYVVFADRDDDSRRAAVRVVLTVSRDEHDVVLDDFAMFVRSVSLDRSRPWDF